MKNCIEFKYSTQISLFQAKDKDTMMSWIGAIQKNNNPDEDVSCFKFFLKIGNLLNYVERRSLNAHVSTTVTPDTLNNTSMMGDHDVVIAWS